MPWPSKLKAVQLYRGTKMDLLQKFGDDQVRLIPLRKSLSRIDDEDVITKVLLECGSIEECKAFVSKVAQLRCITKDKLKLLLEHADGDLEKALHHAQELDKYHCDSQRGTQDTIIQVEPLRTKSDGACFFRAIAYALTKEDSFLLSIDTKIELYLQNLRNKFVETVVEKWDDEVLDSLKMRDLVELEHDKHTPEEYREYMKRKNTWAAQPEVLVGGYIYESLTVYMKPNGKLLKKTYAYPNQSYRDREKGLTIFYNGSNHYSAVDLEKIEALLSEPTYGRLNETKGKWTAMSVNSIAIDEFQRFLLDKQMSWTMFSNSHLSMYIRKVRGTSSEFDLVPVENGRQLVSNFGLFKAWCANEFSTRNMQNKYITVIGMKTLTSQFFQTEEPFVNEDVASIRITLMRIHSGKMKK